MCVVCISVAILGTTRNFTEDGKEKKDSPIWKIHPYERLRHQCGWFVIARVPIFCLHVIHILASPLAFETSYSASPLPGDPFELDQRLRH